MSISTTYSRISHLIDLSLIAGFGYTVYFLFHSRAEYIDNAFGSLVGCNGCFTPALLIHDGVFLGSLAVLYLASFWLRRWFLYIPVRLAVFAGLAIYLADVLTMAHFNTRLNAGDVRTYGAHVGLIWEHIHATGMFAWGKWAAAILFAWLPLAVLWPPQSPRWRRGYALLTLAPGIWVATAYAMEPTSYVHNWALRNVVAANMTPGVAIQYSEAFREQLLAGDTPGKPECRTGRDSREDLILLLLESWSAYQSQLWGGHRNWTPRLDDLARDNTHYREMYAGGFTTNEGMMSLFAGMPFISPIKRFFSVTPFEGAWGREFTVPGLFNGAGYHTAFLTSGDLAFSGKGMWLEHLEFDYLEGHDHPFYDNADRLHFRAAPDDMLYERALDYLAAHRQNSDQPIFAAIQNVSSHHPFIHPHTGERSTEAVFRYMDKTAHDFYLGLDQQGFFDRGGRLLIISDHRAMIPISREELDTYGRAAPSLVPALMVSADEPPREITTPYHQADLLPSIRYHLENQVCTAQPVRDMFDPDSTEAVCLFHGRGDQRDHIDVFCPEGEGTVGLAGDETGFIDSINLTEDRQRAVVEDINRLRIEAREQHRRISAQLKEATE